MKPELKRDVLVNASWLCGLALALAALVWVSLARFHTHKARLVELRHTVEGKRASLEQLPAGTAARDGEHGATRILAGWQELVGSEARRVTELSAAARRAGVTLVGIRCLEPEVRADGQVASVSHELGALGSYRQLGQFLAQVHASEGLLGIEELEIARAPGSDTSEGQLQASLRVTWYAQGPGPAPESPPGKEGQG